MSTRPLTQAEQTLLATLLQNMEPAAKCLIPQLDGARVEVDDDGTYLEFVVRKDAEAVDLPDQPIGGSALYKGPNGEYGELFLWVKGGRLSALELSSYVDEWPTSMPDATWLRFT